MVLYDSSLLIDYLDGGEASVDCVKRHSEETAAAVPLVMFEIYQGEVFKSGDSDFDGLESALSWVEVIDEKPSYAREAAELQEDLKDAGDPLSARDIYVAGAASATNEKLVATDSDFDSSVLRESISVEVV
jgi:predicted nucleic acid-binding protein